MLKKSTQLFFLFAIPFLINAPVIAQSTWNVDPAHAKVTFSTVHNTISDVEGLFNSFETTIVSAKEDFSDAVFDLSIHVESIDTEIKMRDDHLRSPDFFDAQKFPKITFKSTSIEKTQDKNHYKLTGALTMHGITKTITMDLWYRGTITDAKSGNLIAGFQLTGSLNRLDFGVGPKFPKTLISDEIVIKADGEFIKKK